MKVKLAMGRMRVPLVADKSDGCSEKDRVKNLNGSPKEVLAAFTKKCGQLGIVFHDERLEDTAALLAAAKTIVEGLDE